MPDKYGSHVDYMEWVKDDADSRQKSIEKVLHEAFSNSAFEQKLRPQVDKFRPDFILISAGFDSRTGDPLGRFRVTDEGFKGLTQIMLQIAQDYAKSRLVSILEGGYSLEGLSQAVSAHVETLLNSGQF